MSPKCQVGLDDIESVGDDQAWRQVEERIKSIEQRRRASDRNLDRNDGGIGR
jgi:hypothetical protein